MAMPSRAFFNLKLQLRSRLSNLRHYSCSVNIEEKEKSVSPVDDVIIPYRIERGATDILKALASTVGKDYTAPLYKYHDDPYLIPASNIAKRTYALSKESGKKAARYFLEKYPDSFENNPADPVIETFMSPEVITDESDVTEETLLKCIEQSEIKNAKAVYHNLCKKGIELSHQAQQQLLELLCFYNGEEPTREEYIEERWYRQAAKRDVRKLWKENSLADQIFNAMKEKDSLAYCTMIQGLAKYFQVNQALTLYEEMQGKGLSANIEMYNSLISIAAFLRENSESRWTLVQDFLYRMNKECLLPNIGTFNAILDAISRFGLWRNAKPLALSTLAEMKKLNIEPSLGTWYYLLITFCKERGPPSHILYNIMEEIQDKEYQIRHPKDVFFFVTAMDVCHNQLKDKDLAYQIHNLLLRGQNSFLIGDSYKESIYYQHFFKLLCATEDIESFFQFYKTYVPNSYTPEPSVIEEIIKAVRLNGILKYIPVLWSDIILFNQTERERILQLILDVMASGTVTDLSTKFVDIAWDIKMRVDAVDKNRLIRPIQWSGQMIGDIITICLNAGEKEKAWEMIMKLDKEAGEIIGVPKIDCLKKFSMECLKEKQTKKVLYCLRYGLEIGYEELGTFIKENADVCDFTEMERKDIENLISSKSTLNQDTNNNISGDQQNNSQL